MMGFSELKDKYNIVDVINKVTPLRKRGRGYVGLCQFHNDRNPSLQVNEDKQLWFCPVCNTGGDFIHFLHLCGVSYDSIEDWLNEACVTSNSVSREVIKEPEWVQIPPDPKVKVSFKHESLGLPNNVYTYTDVDHTVIGYVCRWNLDDGKKIILPLVYATNGEKSGWKFQGFAKPRPLYGLGGIKDEHVVFIGEGEKVADYGNLVIRDRPFLSWQGGSGAVKYTDWSPIYGKKIVIFPDNDLPGFKAGRKIKEILSPYCDWIRFVKPPEGVSKGWDIVDGKWDYFKFREYIKCNLIEEL